MGAEVEKMVPDTTLRVGKQRHFSWEGDFKLWFDKSSEQFLGGPDSRLQHFNLEKK